MDYLLGALELFGVWILLFWRRSDLRQEMFYFSSTFVFFALLDPLFAPYYWNPASTIRIQFWGWYFNLESIIYNFAISGIAFSTYKVLTNRRIEKKTIYNTGKLIRLIVLNLIGTLLVLTISYQMLRNWILSFVTALYVGALFIFYHRADLIVPMLFSGVTLSTIHTLIILVNDNLLIPGAIHKNWTLNKTLGVFIIGVPLEEILFSLAFGIVVSGLYEYLWGYELKRKIGE